VPFQRWMPIPPGPHIPHLRRGCDRCPRRFQHWEPAGRSASAPRDVCHSNDPHSRGRTHTRRGSRHGVAIPPGMHRRSPLPPLAARPRHVRRASRRYFAEYHARRLIGNGTPIRHGTSAGYLSGCRSVEMCSRDELGRSCYEARAEYRRQTHARGASTLPRRRFSPMAQSDS